MAWSNTAFGGEETIYYSYLIYNGTSPFA